MGRMVVALPLSGLEHEYHRRHTLPPHDIVDLLNAIAFRIHYRMGAPRVRAQALCDEAYQLATALDYTDGIVLAHLTRGHIALYDGKAADVETAFRTALQYVDHLHDSFLEARTLNLMAMYYQKYGGESDSLYYCLTAHDLLAQHEWDLPGRIANLNLLGTAYTFLRDYHVAIPYFEECLTLCRHLEDTPRELYIQWCLARSYYEDGNILESRSLAERGFTLAQQNSETYPGLALTTIRFVTLLADGYLHDEALHHADLWLEKGVALHAQMRQREDNVYLRHAHFNLLRGRGAWYSQRGEWEKAKEVTLQAAALDDSLRSNVENARLHKMLSTIFRHVGEFETALHHFEQFHEHNRAADVATQWERMRAISHISSTITVRRETSQLRKQNADLQQVVSDLHTLQLQLRRHAVQDGLTALFNRRYLEEQLPRLLADAQRDGQPLSLAMLDMDNFKHINDTYRHTVGDVVLQRVAAIIQKTLPPTASAVRYGGDEFLLLLPNTSLTEARHHLDTLCRTIAAEKWSQVALGLSVTMSGGVVVSRTDEPWHILLNRADHHLYAAKRAGKNRLVTAH